MGKIAGSVTAAEGIRRHIAMDGTHCFSRFKPIFEASD